MKAFLITVLFIVIVSSFFGLLSALVYPYSDIYMLR